MKFNTIIHALGAIACIAGIYGLRNAGYVVWQWPGIALLWVLSSYINASFTHKQTRLVEKLDKERNELIEKLHESELRRWETEIRLADASKK